MKLKKKFFLFETKQNKIQKNFSDEEEKLIAKNKKGRNEV